MAHEDNPSLPDLIPERLSSHNEGYLSGIWVNNEAHSRRLAMRAMGVSAVPDQETVIEVIQSGGEHER